MQITKEESKRRFHVRYKALSVHQPYAGKIANGLKPIEVRSRNINYRGNIVICSTASPVIEGYENSVALCIAEIYDVVKFSELTENEKILTQIPKQNWYLYKTFYAWKLRNIKKVHKMPVKGGQGLFNLYSSHYLVDDNTDEMKNFIQLNEELTGERTAKSTIAFILIILMFSSAAITILVLYFIDKLNGGL